MEREEALKLFALSEAYTDKDLRKTYLKLSKKYHPDINNSQDAEEMMKKINEARDVLSSFTFSNDGTLVFKDFDKDHGNKIDHPDVNKYEDFCVMKKKIYELLNDEMERKFERRRKKYGL